MNVGIVYDIYPYHILLGDIWNYDDNHYLCCMFVDMHT